MKDGCFCIIFEFVSPFKNRFITPFKFNSRLMWRVGFGYLGLTILKMSLYDYGQECQSGGTGWRKK